MKPNTQTEPKPEAGHTPLLTEESRVRAIAENPHAIAALLSQRDDLLAACKALLGVDNPPAGEPGHVDYSQAIAQARAVIARAEGREE